MDTEILCGLNDKQKEAVTTTEGYVRVIAGAGSGKTKALTHRYAYLVNYLGVDPSTVLCVTFTNKAANEMRRRVRALVGEMGFGLICTFHGFCHRLLKEDCHVLQIPATFIILDEEDVNEILRECFENLHINSKDLTYKKAIETINKTKHLRSAFYIPLLTDPTLTNLKEEKEKPNLSLEMRVFYEYLFLQRKYFGLDYNDLMLMALFILENNEEVRAKWQKRLQYIMVDEFQDSSGFQYALVEILSDYHKNLFVVGDPDQTIYSWRGARVENILNFDKKHPICKTITMDQNYRSSSKILYASNSLIQKNKIRLPKDLIPMIPKIGQTIYFHARTQYEEADWIAKQIKSLKNEFSYSDIAILYRAHYVSRSIEESLMKDGIPYMLYSGISFYQRKEIKDVLSYLRLISFENDDLSFLRIINEPKRGIGKKRIAFLQDHSKIRSCSLMQSLTENIDHSLFQGTGAKQFVDLITKYKKDYYKLSISDLLDNILEESGYGDGLKVNGDTNRLDNIAELKQSIWDYESSAGEDISLEDYLSQIALYTNVDFKNSKNSISMMTVHNAKGLEFPCVFICGMSEGLFPSRKSIKIEELEEERRLAYVGFTRAKEKLFLTDSEGQNFDGSYRSPSRFIFNAEKSNLDYIVELKPELIDETCSHMNREYWLRNAKDLQISKGHIIEHPQWGKGTVIEISEDGSSYLVEFTEMTRWLSFSFLARLLS